MIKDYNLIQKDCENERCIKSWRQLPTDKQRFCSRSCQESLLAPKSKSKMEKSIDITREIGAQPKVSKDEESTSDKNQKNDTTRILRKSEKESVTSIKNTPKMKNGCVKDDEKEGNTTSEQLKKEDCMQSNNIQNEGKKLESGITNITHAIEKESVKDKWKLGEKKSHTTKYQTLLSNLNQERSNSIQRLDDAGESLLSIAVDDPSVAIRAISEFRNIMKTKLEYMKYGSELIKVARNVDD